MASALAIIESGAVGFIDWLGHSPAARLKTSVTLCVVASRSLPRIVYVQVTGVVQTCKPGGISDQLGDNNLSSDHWIVSLSPFIATRSDCDGAFAHLMHSSRGSLRPLAFPHSVEWRSRSRRHRASKENRREREKRNRRECRADGHDLTRYGWNYSV